MKLGMNLLLWTGEVTEEQFPLIERLAAMGFDGIEVPLFQTSEARLRAVGSAASDLGLELTAVCIGTAEANPISELPKVRQAARDHILRRIDWCTELGASLLCGPFHSALGQLAGRARNSDEWARCVEFLKEAGVVAQAAGIHLSVEPLNRFEAYFLNTAADSARLVREVDNPNVGYLYDTFHSNIEERDVAAALTDNASAMNHVHISENDRGVPGRGHVHWNSTFDALRQSGYDGWLTIEAFGRRLPELAAATCIWRDLFESEELLASEGLEFMRSKVGA